MKGELTRVSFAPWSAVLPTGRDMRWFSTHFHSPLFLNVFEQSRQVKGAQQRWWCWSAQRGEGRREGGVGELELELGTARLASSTSSTDKDSPSLGFLITSEHESHWKETILRVGIR